MTRKQYIGGSPSLCQCALSSTMCYGSVQCDCSNPRAAKCQTIGLEVENEIKNVSKMKKEIQNILKKNKKKNNLINKNNKIIRLKDRYVSEIKNGLKTVEIKPLNRNTQNIKIGNIVTFKGNSKQVRAKVTNITHHKNLETALRNGTLKKTLPRSSKTYKQGIIELKKSLGNTNNKQIINLHLSLIK